MPKQLSTRVVGGLLASWVFLVPTHFFLSCCREQAALQGLLNSYLVPTIYASELISLLLLLVLLPATLRQLQTTWMRWRALSLLILVGLMGVHSSTAQFPLIGFVTWVKLLYLGWLGISLLSLFHQAKQRAQLWQWVSLGLVAAIWFQVGLGWYQYLTQSHLAGYWLLGEPQYGVLPGLSTATTSTGQEVRLAYGTTAHPNVLANLVILYTLLLWLIAPKHRRSILFASTAVASSAVFITQSLSAALLGLFGAGLIWLVQSGKAHRWLAKLVYRLSALALLTVSALVIIPVLTILSARYLPDNYSVQRRAWLQEVALKITSNQPLTGVGLTQFTPQVVQFAQTPDQWRFLQPVHNTGWLWIAETGLLGMLLLIGIILLASTTLQIGFITSLALLLIPLSFDHFFLSLPEGRAALLVTVVLITLGINKRQKT